MCCVQPMRNAIDHNYHIIQPRLDTFIFLCEETQKFGDKEHQWAVIVSLTAATQMYDDDDDDRVEATFI